MRRVVLGIAVVALLVSAGGALAYRATGPSLVGGGRGTKVVAMAGQHLFAIYPVWSQAGIRIDDIEVVGAPDRATRVWVYRPGGGSHIGSYTRNTIAPNGPERSLFKPAVGQWIAGDSRHSVDLVVTFRAEQPGTYRTSAVRVTYGDGLRRRTTVLPFETCFMALDRRIDGTPVEACDEDTKGGIFFEL